MNEVRTLEAAIEYIRHLQEAILLRNGPETGASDGESTSSSSDEEISYMILPATTVTASSRDSSSEGGEKEEEERHELADPPQTPGAAYIAAPLPTTKNEQVERM